MKNQSPSKTAIIVAKSQALIGASPEAELAMDPEAIAFARRSLEIAGHGAFVRALRFKTFRRMLRGFESLMIPGLARHHVLRKQFIETRVRKALRSGIRQVIQVGAGLDSLCFRLHREWPEANFLEWDHPATQALKRRVLDYFGTGENLQLRPRDLSNSEPPCLEGFAKYRKLPSMIIAEGVLMYLPRETVKAWLRRWREAYPAGSRLLFTHLGGPRFHRQSAAVDAWLRLAGEPFRWHADRKTVAALLADAGWKPSGFHPTWQSRNGRVSAAGEWISESWKRFPELKSVASPTQHAPAGIQVDRLSGAAS